MRPASFGLTLGDVGLPGLEGRLFGSWLGGIIGSMPGLPVMFGVLVAVGGFCIFRTVGVRDRAVPVREASGLSPSGSWTLDSLIEPQVKAGLKSWLHRIAEKTWKNQNSKIPKHCLTWLNGLTWNPTNGVPSGQTVRFKCDRVALRSSGHVDLRGLTECADLKAQCSMTDLLLNFLWTTCLLAFTALRNLTQIHHPGTVWPVSSNKQRSKLSCSPSHKANFDCRALAGGWISSPQGH